MKDPIKRTETTHIDEVTRTANMTHQWLLENANKAGTHPITYNNRLAFFICGQEAFADIAQSIENAKESIDICCWGFDPAMELVRSSRKTWPRGRTYGELLVAAGKRGVKVRLLVWHDLAADLADKVFNMPGYTHNIDPLHRKRPAKERQVDVGWCLLQTRDDLRISTEKMWTSSVAAEVARRHYCMDWYESVLGTAFGTELPELANIEVRTFCGDAGAISKSLASERDQPSNLRSLSVEKVGMVRFGTLHQKPILIDFFHDEGRAAVGYVMGLNSLTEYWDTTDHKYEDPIRERSSAVGAQYYPWCDHVTPMRDYACRIDGGGALLSIHHNFIKLWGADAQSMPITNPKGKKRKPSMPETCLRKARPGDSIVQIVRTQPVEGDKTIKEVYFQATDEAALNAGYIYLENQYFQYKEWADRLMAKRRKVMDSWAAECRKSGKTERDMPTLHVFIVIPVPERKSMIPRTYDTLATLGQQEALKGQCKLIKEKNEEKPMAVMAGIGQPMKIARELPEVVKDANRIKKPDEKMLETSYGLKVCTVMLNSCTSVSGMPLYREIYIHSKLMLINDTFVTLGSANLNQRSMAADSERNLAAIAPDKVSELRRRIWSQLGGAKCEGGGGSRKEIESAFYEWKRVSKFNEAEKRNGRIIPGYLLPLDDDRSSLTREG